MEKLPDFFKILLQVLLGFAMKPGAPEPKPASAPVSVSTPAPASAPAALPASRTLSAAFQASAVPASGPRRAIDLVIGDSIAWMTGEDARTPPDEPDPHKSRPYPFQRLPGDAVGGRRPAAVAHWMEETLKKNPDAFRGKTVLLSTGASNDPGRLSKPVEAKTPEDMAAIAHELKMLKDGGAAAVVVLGVGQGNRLSPDEEKRLRDLKPEGFRVPQPGEDIGVFGAMNWNARLADAVAEAGGGGTAFVFAGPLKTGCPLKNGQDDRIHPHPRDFSALVRNAEALAGAALPPQEHAAQPPRASAEPGVNGP